MPRSFAALPGLVLFTLLAAAVASPVLGQTGVTSTVPSPGYFSCFEPFYAGEYKSAQQAFKDMGQGGVKTVNGQWIDWICYHTMSGECFYHTGRLAQALDQYEAALKLAIAHNGWMLRVQFPDTIQPSSSTARAKINWATSTRRTLLGQFPSSMSVMMGQINNDNVVRMGGVIQPPSLYPVCVQEVVRCTALALRRRKELLGPIGAQDPLTNQLIQTFSQRSAPANHWSQSWISVQLGIAYATAGRNAQATTELQASLLASGQFDHPLTATALLELGKLAMDQGNYVLAGGLFMEATMAAGQFGEADIVEEGMRLALTCHMASNQPGAFAPLLLAVPWAKSNDFRHLQTSLAVMAADNLAHHGQTVAAATALQQAIFFLRGEIKSSDVAARASYVNALITYQQGQVAAGDAALVLAMAFYKTGSKRLFQIGLVDRLFISGVLTPRVANDLFTDVLREPLPADWVHDPMETMAVEVTPHPLPLEHWFEIALDRKEIDKALEIADLARRHKFYNLLPMGGRLLSFQWLLGAPEEVLGDAGKLQRQALLARYPKIAELNTQVKALQLQLSREPLVAAPDKAKEHDAALAQLAKLAAMEETLLRELALRREPGAYVFPQLRRTRDVQAALAPGQLCLIFFNTQLATNVFVINREKYNHWRLDAPGKVSKDLANMLRELGQYDRSQPLTTAQFRDTKWKATSAEIFKLLFKSLKPEAFDPYDELIVVPDGAVWYIPFEALQIAKGGTVGPLLNRMRVRYSPLLSLVLPDQRPARPAGHTAVVTGKLLPKEAEELAVENVEALKGSLPGVTALSGSLPGTSNILSKLCQRLVVLAEVDDNVRGPLEWSPMVLDRGKPGSAMAAWLMLPWGGPEQVLLPGYHTAAEYGLKKGGTGDELFIPAMSLMATGTRTVLLSRWRVGGQTCQDLMREFAQELPHTSASAAWQRSVQLAWQSELDFEREPRLTRVPGDDAIKADHPFLWAGYLVIDSGAVPKKDEAPKKAEAKK